MQRFFSFESCMNWKALMKYIIKMKSFALYLDDRWLFRDKKLSIYSYVISLSLRAVVKIHGAWEKETICN